MLKFYLWSLWNMAKALWKAVFHIEGIIAVVFFVILLFNQQLGARLLLWEEGGISPQWAWLPIAILFLHLYLKAVYENYRELENRRNKEADALRAQLDALREDTEGIVTHPVFSMLKGTWRKTYPQGGECATIRADGTYCLCTAPRRPHFQMCDPAYNHETREVRFGLYSIVEGKLAGRHDTENLRLSEDNRSMEGESVNYHHPLSYKRITQKDDLACLLGTWHVAVGERSYEWTFEADRSVSSTQDSPHGVWSFEDTKIRIRWNLQAWDTFDRPLDPSGTSGSSWTKQPLFATKLGAAIL